MSSEVQEFKGSEVQKINAQGRTHTRYSSNNALILIEIEADPYI